MYKNFPINCIAFESKAGFRKPKQPKFNKQIENNPQYKHSENAHPIDGIYVVHFSNPNSCIKQLSEAYQGMI